MSGQYSTDPMLDMYIFETAQNIEQLETSILSSEKTGCYGQNAIDEIFRMMHTIKGSSAMMLFNGISVLAHAIEDVFYFLREGKPQNVTCSTLSDLVLESVDFIKAELEKIKTGNEADGDSAVLIEKIKEYLSVLKQQNPSAAQIRKPGSPQEQHYYISPAKASGAPKSNYYKATVYFEDGCEMENIRAYAIIHNLKEFSEDVFYFPEDILDHDGSIQTIREQGFVIYVKTGKSYEEMHTFLMQSVFLKDLELYQLQGEEEFKEFKKPKTLVIESDPVKVPEIVKNAEGPEQPVNLSVAQSIISVNVTKLDKLLDLVGEMVIAEAMVTQNPDLKGLELGSFQKSARQLHKITSELQDAVMSIRMVPLSTTFHKMHRIVRDMSKKLGKNVQLTLVGEETEVDKNIIEHISDPLMHLVRNSIDHGIEAPEDRKACKKSVEGNVTLEAKGAGNDVLILVKDDGKGMNRSKILKRARENHLLQKPESEMTDKEVFSLVFLPGFSTKDNVTEFSGRGVGMDVVTKNIEAVGGTVSIESTEGIGTVVTLKIPLTLAIIDGMNVKVGNSRYTIPITTIKESFRPKESDLICDPDGNEMIMVRGECYPILRIHEYYHVKTDVRNFTDGILIMVEQDNKTLCIFADELLGQQQVVVKALPSYIRNGNGMGKLAGCTLLGDGSISLILDIAGLINYSSVSA